MLAKVKTAAVVGLDAREVEVEVDIMGGLPAMKEADHFQILPRSASCSPNPLSDTKSLSPSGRYMEQKRNDGSLGFWRHS